MAINTTTRQTTAFTSGNNFAFSLGNFIEVASSFVGFMFPSRWYSLKEKSSLSQAEKESFRTFLLCSTDKLIVFLGTHSIPEL